MSTRLMEFGGSFGMRGWQWLFLLEGLPAIVLGLAVPRLLASGPEDVLWLGPREKIALLGAIYLEEAKRQVDEKPLHDRFKNILHLVMLPAAAYFLLMSGLYTLSFWIPRILQSTGLSLPEIGWATSLIFAFGGVTLVVWSRFADQSPSPRYHLMSAFALAGIGFALATKTHPLMAVAGLGLASAGVLTGMPIFWGSVPTGCGSERAVIVASINAIGNVGGLLGPYLMGLFLAKTHRFTLALMLTAAEMILAIPICALSRKYMV
jgi:ACS family tartrate transporter-like MFS transporter